MFKIIISHTLGTFLLQFQEEENKIAYHSFRVGKMNNLLSSDENNLFIIPIFLPNVRKWKTISKHISSQEMGPKDLQKQFIERMSKQLFRDFFFLPLHRKRTFFPKLTPIRLYELRIYGRNNHS